MTEADRIEKANEKAITWSDIGHLNIRAHTATLRGIHNMILLQQKTNDLLEILIEKQGVCICEPDEF